jgi:hypothetical protein
MTATVRRASSESALDPGKLGLVMVDGELWRAATVDQIVAAGERVKVHWLAGLTLHVRPEATAFCKASEPPAPARSARVPSVASDGLEPAFSRER